MYQIRTTKPGAGNKNYIRKANGGWNTCIKGKPTDPECNVLANCVGYASGRYNEIINEVRGTTGCTYTNLNCNAENFVERAKADGLKTGSKPKVGAIMCWQKGSLASGDGAGHVCIVEKVNNAKSVYTSESGYGSKAFWNATRTNANGRWGIGSAYKFRCFIYLPDDVQKIVDGDPVITPTVERDETKDQIEVKIDCLRVRTGAGLGRTILGFASKGFYNYYEKVTADKYDWYRIADNQWIAYKDTWATLYPAKKPEPTYKYSIGDKVIINGPLYASSNAAKATGHVKNKKTKITRLAKGAKHPYNTTGDLGWMNESDIKPQ